MLTKYDPGFIFANVSASNMFALSGGRPRVERDEVGALEQLVERVHLLDAVVRVDVEEGVVHEHRHPERERPERDPVADLAVARRGRGRGGAGRCR